jgi:hypothetical protein
MVFPFGGRRVSPPITDTVAAAAVSALSAGLARAIGFRR